MAEENDSDQNTRVWLRYAQAAAAIFGLLVFGGFIWVIDAGENIEAVAQRARVLIPFCTVGIAAVTFFTIIWRGKMTDRQVQVQNQQLRQQQIQIDQIIRQNDASDDAAFASLLLEGARLLNEGADLSKRTGVAILKKIINDPKQDRLQVPALDLLAADWAQNYLAYTTKSYLEQVRNAMIFGCARGYVSNVSARFSAPSKGHYWPEICGFQNQEYSGGLFLENNYAAVNRDKGVQFSNVEFHDIDFTAGDRVTRGYSGARDCQFNQCSFAEISRNTILLNQFSDCDFSGCHFRGQVLPERYREKLQYSIFHSGEPPTPDRSDWHQIIGNRTPITLEDSPQD